MRSPLRPRPAPSAASARDAAHLSAMRAAQLVHVAARIRWSLYLMLALLAAGLGWAALARVDQVTRAEARVVPDGREQVIASLEGGLLRRMLVHEGETVSAGQALAQLDPTRFEAQQNESRARRAALLASLARLQAEAEGRPPRFPPELAAQPALLSAENAAYAARRQALDEALGASRRSADLLARELRVAETLSAEGLVSEVEVMRLQRQLNEQQLQGRERLNRYRQEASGELLKLRAELAQIDEQVAGRGDVLRRTVLTSPVAGVVKNIRAVTVGGVVAPGAPMLEIVPASSRLLVEARVKPSEIGFLRVGQPAELKLAAYDHASYGGLHGRIEHISPDALGDPERSAGPGAESTYYRVLVRTEQAALHANGQVLAVIPGMTGSVDVRTGERSVLSFLLRPLTRSREAFTEG